MHIRSEQIAQWLLLIILVGVTIHTPVMVYVQANWPTYDVVIKAWKEVLLGAVLVLLAWSVTRRGMWRQVARDRLLWLVAAIGAWHIGLLLALDNSAAAEQAGLLIDVRFYLIFAEVYVLLRYLEVKRRSFMMAAAVGAAIVLGIGLLQATVLPKDILAHIGYSETTILPYQMVDMNPDYVRINSTLRGPNPVGAFMVIVIGMLSAWLAVRYKQLCTEYRLTAIGGLVLSAAVLYASHSRSAWLAAAVVVGLSVWVVSSRRVRYWASGLAVAGVMLGGGVLYAYRDAPVVAQVFFHEDPAGGSAAKSNGDHVDSLEQGFAAVSDAPLGEGVGSTGSASLLSDKPKIIENQYLFMAHESGWLGLLLQLTLFGVVLARLWRARSHWLALAGLASGIGLGLIGLLLPVWVDDAVSLYWWVLAGLAIGSSGTIRTQYANTSTRHQKAKRTA